MAGTLDDRGRAGPRFVAHRGGAARWAENSLTAFRGAIASGVRLLELDVHLTADGEAAVIHDPTLERTTSGAGPIARCTVADLRRARLRGPDGVLTEDCVPTLDEVLAVAVPAGAGLLIEIKSPGRALTYERRGPRVERVPGPRYEGLERKVLATLAAADWAERCVVMAFNPAVVAEVRRLAPAQATTLLVDRHVVATGVPPVEAVDWAREAGVTFLGLHHSLCDGALVDAAHRAGIAVGVFTVNDAAERDRLVQAGVDVVITDRPDLIPPDPA
jgi:glycerophosphoryl diester phosphodiesterase